MKTKAWARAAVVRAVKTAAQTAAATIGTAMVLSQVDWRAVLSAAALAGVLSVLTSLAGLPEADESPVKRMRRGKGEVP